MKWQTDRYGKAMKKKSEEYIFLFYSFVYVFIALP